MRMFMNRICRTCLILAALLLIGAPKALAAGTGNSGVVVGYYAAWASASGFAPDRLPAEQLTHVNYAFAEISNGKAVLTSPDQDRKNLQGLTALRKRNPDLKIVLSLGGWDGSGGFSDAASTPQRRETFAQSCLDLLLAHDLDGIDLDWEYPVSGGSGTHRLQDKQNFTLLLKTLRQKLDLQGQRDGKRYCLSIAGAFASSYLKNIEPQAVAELVDYIFLMTYDFHGPWETVTGFNAPLYAGSGGGVDAAVSAWLKQGVSEKKLVLGMPMYGYIYQGVNSAGLNSGYSSGKSISYDAIRRSYLNNTAYQQLRHAQAEVPYLVGNGVFLTYDDETSIAAKASLAKARELGGFGFWELSQDRSGELLKSALAAWNSTGGFRDVPSDAWYATAVAELSSAGLVSGTAPGAFSPGQTVTRGQLVTMLHRLAGEPAASGTVRFSDVSAGSYYARAVSWAADQGIVAGFADGTFRPDRAVSREQMMVILWRYADMLGADGGRWAGLQNFQDVGVVSGYAYEPLCWAVGTRLLQGTAAGLLDPSGTTTRAQAVVFLSRFRQLAGV